VIDPADIDDPLIPEREDWEDRVADILAGDDVDADLGRRMARDAIRVSRGELSDKEFHEMYREEVREAFDTEDWSMDSEDTTNE
jgi:molybdopterin-containing oxidoreductase family iron-sulfur binding subunit